MTSPLSAGSSSRMRHGSFGTGEVLVVALATLLSVAAVGRTASIGVQRPGWALAFAGLVALGEIARVRLPGGRETAPIAIAGSLGYAFVTSINGTAARHGALQVTAVVAVAMVAGSFLHVAAGRPTRPDELARRLLVIALAAAVYRPFVGSLEHHVQRQVLVMLGAAVLAGILDTFLAALAHAEREHARFGPAFADELRALVGITAAIGSTGILIALAARQLGLWALPVFCVPLLVTQFSFRRYTAIRATYLQTIRALSRVTEVGGYVEAGHSRRVGELSLGIGRDLGMGEAELLELEYGAVLHDIGQLSFADPVPGGSTLVLAPVERRRVAELGAEIVRSTGAMAGVAEIVERQADPYRSAGELADQTLPLASRIIKVANAYDDLVGTSMGLQAREDALEHLRMSMAYEYDPRVVDALTRVLERQAIPTG
ncbi:MAG: hypothetical protein QOJ92_1963 [Frankiales bacterium]|nr:hypothetical protein [Frankiales bacterium]